MANADLLYPILPYLKNQNNFVFLWNGKSNRENYKSFVFLNPEDIISTYKHNEIIDCFSKIEGWLSKGYYLAGYISYEAASAFEDTLPKVILKEIPLLWFGVYNKPIVIGVRSPEVGFLTFKRDLTPYCIENLKPTKSQKEYLSDILRIKDYIKRGDTYQVNYTFKCKFKFSGCPYNMFFNLNKEQSVSCAAFISFDNKRILSLSPELFLERKGNALKMKPMKGTIERGKDISEDRVKEKQLRNSRKDRAENIMIVDMLRNDLGRISKTGSVKTARLFETEKYQTLFQMTSTIRSRLRSRLSWYEIFKSIFPSGSVTGAPKIRTMQLINELEKTPRNIYTGCIGYISPENGAVFNVAIRTILLDIKNKQGELGIGSGITILSDPKQEYEECKLKAQFFTKKFADFKLIETMLWRNGKLFLLDMHLKRLKDSAAYFDYEYSKNYILKSLKEHTDNFKSNKIYKVRLLLSKDGAVEISSSVLKNFNDNKIKKIIFSKKIIDNKNVFLYHKTTNRKLYDDEYLKYRKRGFFDVLFLNKNGQVSEGAISNIIIKKGKYYYTPPIKSGLLNGIYRQYLLKGQPFPLKEKILFKQDINRAEKIFLCNSVKGLVEVKLCVT